jgi:uncharacterized surface protein with fasciclin (FAS1) repeats
MKLRSFLLSLTLGLSLVATASAGDYGSGKAKTVVDIALGSPDHTTLVAAIKAAGLVETLSGPGPYTVFAPTNAAFEKLPPGTVDSLLKPENKAQLVSVLTYHVVPGKIMAADIRTMSAPTVNGKNLSVKAGADGVMINDAKVTTADLKASNGVVHVIDTVVLP